jgi:hypothetical protein
MDTTDRLAHVGPIKFEFRADERKASMGVVEDKIKDLKEREKKVLQVGGENSFCGFAHRKNFSFTKGFSHAC